MRRSLLALPLIALALTGCGLFSENPAKPRELQPFDASMAARVVWSARVDNVELPLSVAATGDRFTVADSSGTVVALRATDGSEIWRTQVDAKLSAGVGSDGRFAAVVTRNQELVVMDAGRVLWRKALPAPVLTAPLVAGERVFVLGVDRAVSAFDAAEGRKLWELRRPGDALLLAQAGGLIAYKDTLVVGQGPRLAGVDPLRGTLRWEASVANPRGTNEVERLADVVGPLLRQGELICARAFQAAVGCINAERGSLSWNRQNAGVQGVGGDAETLVGVDSVGRVSAWRIANGEALWTLEDLQFRQLTAPLMSGKAAIVGDYQGYVHFLDRSTGKTLQRVQAGSSPLVAPPVQIGTTVLVVGKDGGVHALRPE